jgi:hypothetical protein
MVLGVMIALTALVLIVRWIVIALRNRSLKGRAEASYSTDS